MPRDKCGITGKVTAIVYDKYGFIKCYPRGFLRRLFCLPAKKMIVVNNNIVTNQGDALVADALAPSPARALMNNANSVIGVGTGYVSATKTVTALVTAVGSYEAMDTGYPQLKGTWGNADDNVLIWKATSEAGDWTATGLDEVALTNGTDMFAYANLTPNVTLASTDTLEVTWEITFLGA